MPELASWKTRLTHLIGRTHLIYLGLLPALATFAVLRAYSYGAYFLLFLGGVVLHDRLDCRRPGRGRFPG